MKKKLSQMINTEEHITPLYSKEDVRDLVWKSKPLMGYKEKGLMSFVKRNILRIASISIIPILLVSVYIIQSHLDKDKSKAGLASQNSGKDNKKSSSFDVEEGFDIAGVRVIELSRAELEKINVMVGDTSVKLKNEELFLKGEGSEKKKRILTRKNYDLGRDSLLVKYGFTLNRFRLNNYIIQYVGWDHKEYSSVSPIIIYSIHKHDYPDNLGKGFTMQFFDIYRSPIVSNYHELSDKVFNTYYNDFIFKNNSGIWQQKVFSKLIPIKITLDSKLYGKTKYKAALYLWYAPTEEFVDALPARYRDALLKEIEIIKSVNNGDVKANEACKELEEESFFDICRSVSKLISESRLYPNPAHSSATCRFNLVKSGKISISLHEISGAFIKTLIKDQYFKSGNNEINLKLSDVRQGAYLMAITTEDGEQIVQRLIIEK